MDAVLKSEQLFGQKQKVVVGGKKFYVRELLVSANSTKILEALGGLEQARVERSDLNKFLETANQNQWYLCFIGEEAVRAVWGGSEWHMYAYAVESPSGWSGGREVFSRN